jgi:Zn-finger domain associated with topoisomerase type I
MRGVNKYNIITEGVHMLNENPGCLGFILQFFGLMLKNINHEDLPYGLRDDFLSKAELSFYKVLFSAIDERAVICPKVSLSEIFFIKRPNENMAYRNKIDRKHVDFVLCSNDIMRPIAGIELDDTSHQRQDRVERDIFVDEVFKTVCLPLIRIPNKNSYTIAEIKDKLEFLFTDAESVASVDAIKSDEIVDNTKRDAPICPKCGVPMVLRVAKRGENVGEKFYGCPNYPKCRETVKVK